MTAPPVAIFILPLMNDGLCLIITRRTGIPVCGLKPEAHEIEHNEI
jgi:hypothetical protein